MPAADGRESELVLRPDSTTRTISSVLMPRRLSSIVSAASARLSQTEATASEIDWTASHVQTIATMGRAYGWNSAPQESSDMVVIPKLLAYAAHWRNRLSSYRERFARGMRIFLSPQNSS